jgi:large subunit ribosomal protein L22
VPGSLNTGGPDQIQRSLNESRRKVMEQKVSARSVRIGPRKVNIVARLIRNKGIDEALNILRYVPKAASPILAKLIKSAAAAAGRHPEMDTTRLYIKELRTDGGPLLRYAKRFIPRAQGRASKIHVRTAHVTLVVSDEKRRPAVKA